MTRIWAAFRMLSAAFSRENLATLHSGAIRRKACGRADACILREHLHVHMQPAIYRYARNPGHEYTTSRKRERERACNLFDAHDTSTTPGRPCRSRWIPAELHLRRLRSLQLCLHLKHKQTGTRIAYFVCLFVCCVCQGRKRDASWKFKRGGA